jgi:hypothetical protein
MTDEHYEATRPPGLAAARQVPPPSAAPACLAPLGGHRVILAAATGFLIAGADKYALVLAVVAVLDALIWLFRY